MASGTAYAQYEKVVVIDTITEYDAPPWIRKISAKADTSEWLSWPLPAAHVMQVYFIDTLQNLRILIDDKCGYIELKNTFHGTSDTIRIAHIRSFHNCTPDSVYTTKHRYLRDPTDTIEELEYLRSEYHSKLTREHLHKSPLGGKRAYKEEHLIQQCRKTFPSTYSICVDGRVYIVPLRLSWQQHTSAVGHGYKSRRHSKRYYKRNKTAIYFHFHSRTINHALHAEVNLQPKAP